MERIMQNIAITGKAEPVAISRHITKVYWWMFIALLTTALVSAFALANPNFMMNILKNSTLFYGLMIAEIGLVLVVSAAINRISAMLATAIFFLYAALNGLTLSVIFLAFTKESIALTFFITAGTFGAMAIYGTVTKKDLTGIGNMAFMGLIGIIIASVANLFMKSSAINLITGYIGVLVFVGLTAYDAQKIKAMAPMMEAGGEAERKGAIIGALALYLDFINLFLMLLRIFGRRR